MTDQLAWPNGYMDSMTDSSGFHFVLLMPSPRTGEVVDFLVRDRDQFQLAYRVLRILRRDGECILFDAALDKGIHLKADPEKSTTYEIGSPCLIFVKTGAELAVKGINKIQKDIKGGQQHE